VKTGLRRAPRRPAVGKPELRPSGPGLLRSASVKFRNAGDAIVLVLQIARIVPAMLCLTLELEIVV
jgi:hypothetical protein